MKYLISLSFLICISFHTNALESKPDQWKQVPNFLLSYKNIQEAMCPFPEKNITIRESGTLQYIFSGEKKIFECAYRNSNYSLHYCSGDIEMMCRYQNRDEIIKRASSLISQANTFKEEEKLNVIKIRRQVSEIENILEIWQDKKNIYLIKSLELQTMELAKLISEDYLKNLNLELKNEYDVKRNKAVAEKKAEEERKRLEQARKRQEQLEQASRIQAIEEADQNKQVLSLVIAFILFGILIIYKASRNADERQLLLQNYESKKESTLKILKKRTRDFNSFIKTLSTREKVFCLKCHSTDLGFLENNHLKETYNVKKDGSLAKIKTGRIRSDFFYIDSDWECKSCKTKIKTTHANVGKNFYAAPLNINQYYTSIQIHNSDQIIDNFAYYGELPKNFKSPWFCYKVSKSGKFTKENEYLYPNFSAPKQSAGVFSSFLIALVVFILIRFSG